MMMRAFGGGSGSSGPSSRCQDCGNKAKRDCAHKRCRTCCMGKGFECQTHIKSTWVNPNNSHGRSKTQTQTQTLLHNYHDDLPSSPHHVHQHNPKRLRVVNSSTGFDEEEMGGNFRPPEASFPAMLRCIRVSSKDDSVTHYAYQTSVSIGGHVFKGILYDQGMDPPTPDHHFLAEPHQPNLSNAHYHHALMASASSDHDQDQDEDHHDSHINVPSSSSCPSGFISSLMNGIEFYQHSLPKS